MQSLDKSQIQLPALSQFCDRKEFTVLTLLLLVLSPLLLEHGLLNPVQNIDPIVIKPLP